MMPQISKFNKTIIPKIKRSSVLQKANLRSTADFSSETIYVNDSGATNSKYWNDKSNKMPPT